MWKRWIRSVFFVWLSLLFVGVQYVYDACVAGLSSEDTIADTGLNQMHAQADANSYIIYNANNFNKSLHGWDGAWARQHSRRRTLDTNEYPRSVRMIILIVYYAAQFTYILGCILWASVWSAGFTHFILSLWEYFLKAISFDFLAIFNSSNVFFPTYNNICIKIQVSSQKTP